MNFLGHIAGPNDNCVVCTLGELFLFISCSYQPTECAPTYLGSKSLVTTGTTARQPKPNGSCANLLLPVKGGSEAVNWGQQGAEGHWEACGGGYLQSTHQRASTNLPHHCQPTLPMLTQGTQPGSDLSMDDGASTSSPASHCLQGGLPMMMRTGIPQDGRTQPGPPSWLQAPAHRVDGWC
jgi:hypothetical protein